jgi:hypothetical protein
MSLEPSGDGLISSLNSDLLRVERVAGVFAQRRAGLLSCAEGQDALGIPLRYRSVMELAALAVDDEALDRFERLGERWAGVADAQRVHAADDAGVRLTTR